MTGRRPGGLRRTNVLEKLLFPIPSYKGVITDSYNRTHRPDGSLYARGGHRATDVMASEGARGKAMFSGTALKLNIDPAFGLHVGLYRTKGDIYQIFSFAHCKRFSKYHGAPVRRGARLFKVGSTGFVSGAHSHIEEYHVPVDQFHGKPEDWSRATWLTVWSNYHHNPYQHLVDARGY